MRIAKKDTVVRTMRFERSMWDKIKAEAIDLNMSQSRLIREIIDAYFDQVGKQDKSNN